MKSIIIYLLFGITLLYKTNINAQENKKNTSEEVATDLIGIIQRSDFQKGPFSKWFYKNYHEYALDVEMVKRIRPIIKDVKIKLFIGTWCTDSQEHVPAIFKILDAVKFEENNISLYGVTEYDKSTPEGYEKGLSVYNVPSLIFYKDGKEINRIVEAPIVSLEEDMLNILTENNYKHTYDFN